MRFSRKDLANIIVPLIIEQTLAVTIGMADSVMVSSAGEAAISGVSLVDTVNLLLVYLFSALSAGGAVIISQFVGKDDKYLALKAAKQLVWVVFLTAMAITVVAVAFRKPLLSLIFGSIEKDVMDNALIYFLFTALSYPFLGVYNACAAIFRSMGNSKTSMYSSVVMNLINIGGNAILIMGFGMGAAGAAIATLFSRVIGAGIMLLLLHNKNNIIYLEKMFDYKPDIGIIKNVCAIGIPNGLESGMFQFGKVLTQSVISTFGTVQIAANAVGNTLASFQYTPGIAIGLAMVTIVGQCVGAGEKKQAKYYTAILLGIAFAMLFVVSAVLCIFADPIIGFFGLSAESSAVAKQLIFSHSLFACLMHPFAFAIANSFRAASDVKYPLIMSTFSMWVFRVGFSYLLGIYFNLGVLGVWLAMYCDWIFRGTLNIIRFVRGTWLTKYKYE
ncbi:MAG: MATE family efflux transporter [Clostridia bacterium]|nr:MATE family efflux transporter [Clostridia bacterium]